MKLLASCSSLCALMLVSGQLAAWPLDVGLGCPWCGAADAPATLTSEAKLPKAGEPGTRLDITGTVYQPDRRTPAAGVLLYVYHTNARGVYANRDGDTNRSGHGSLRGWLRTDAHGRYHIATVRPGAYPGRSDPAQVHITVTPPDGRERFVDSIEFDDDTPLTAQMRARRTNTGGSGIVHPFTDANGVQHVVRDIYLER
jgi:protocatechuate 3,4-dioxygenase, beta subunit